MMVLWKERGGEADLGGDGVKLFLIDYNRLSLTPDAVRRTGLPLDELSLTLHAKEHLPPKEKEKKKIKGHFKSKVFLQKCMDVKLKSFDF